ncbi:MAG: type II toxin-antitoxin system VapB family antitoxin [Candidatus Dormiibacterota bacterium]
MRTTLDFDDALMDSLMSQYPGVSRTDAIERTVRSWLLETASTRLRALGGTVELEDRSAALRDLDRSS